MSEKADVKSSRMQKGRKTINYLQKLKDEGTPIVQMCPGPRDQFWTMAAEMADVDICRLTVPGDGSDPEMQIKLAPYWIKCVRNAAKIIHINFYMQTPTYASKEAAVANGALYMNCGADSLLPMGIRRHFLNGVRNVEKQLLRSLHIAVIAFAEVITAAFLQLHLLPQLVQLLQIIGEIFSGQV